MGTRFAAPTGPTSAARGGAERNPGIPDITHSQRPKGGARRVRDGVIRLTDDVSVRPDGAEFLVGRGVTRGYATLHPGMRQDSADITVQF